MSNYFELEYGVDPKPCFVCQAPRQLVPMRPTGSYNCMSVGISCEACGIELCREYRNMPAQHAMHLFITHIWNEIARHAAPQYEPK